MLTQQLRELEKDGLINRIVYPVVPPKTEYSLTDFGRTLTPILDEMCKWGNDYLPDTTATVCCRSTEIHFWICLKKVL
jgi:DNA-binding HxlR family transcriptional regulator